MQASGDSMIPPDLVDMLVVFLVGYSVIQGLWLLHLTRQVRNHMRAQEALAAQQILEHVEAEKNTSIEDIFLLHRSGLLLKHYTKRMRPNVDSDVLSGMLVAVQEFIKDSFRGEKGALNEIWFGDVRIVVLEGQWTIVACLVRGERVTDIQPQIAAAMREVEDKYGDLLMNWDGTLDAAPEVDVIMRRLISGGYMDAGQPKKPQPAIILQR
jgi:hypothetical protein